MRHPTVAYQRLATDCPTVHPLRAARRPALAVLVAAAAISIAATGRATAALVLSTALCWSFAIVWQLLAVAAMARSRDGRLSFAQRVDLIFTGHAPWSLWLLVTAAWSRLFAGHTDLYVLLCTFAIPALWTALIVYGFCKGALGLTPKVALWRMVLHQLLIWTFAFIYVGWAVALWPRLFSAL